MQVMTGAKQTKALRLDEAVFVCSARIRAGSPRDTTDESTTKVPRGGQSETRGKTFAPSLDSATPAFMSSLTSGASRGL